jgi:hypothetical protein
MKQLVPFILLAAAAFGLGALLRPALLAHQPQTGSEAAEPSCPACRPAKAAGPTTAARTRPKNDEEALAELLAVLEEVKSREAFLATVVALTRFDDDKAALAAVIRNGDRLGVFKDVFVPDGGGPASEIVMGYLSGQLKAELRQGGGAPAACYRSAFPVPTSAQPVPYPIDASAPFPVPPPSGLPQRGGPASCLPALHGPGPVPVVPPTMPPADSGPKPSSY